MLTKTRIVNDIAVYSTVALVPPMSTMDVWRGINVVLYNCVSWYKFVNTHLYHSRQLYNIHIAWTRRQ